MEFKKPKTNKEIYEQWKEYMGVRKKVKGE
jgi:hypothetical protein